MDAPLSWMPGAGTPFAPPPSARHCSDVTIRDLEVNKTIARKRYAPRKQSLVHSKGSLKSSLRVCSQTTFTFIALILAIVMSVLGGLCNIRLPERKSPIGTSPNLSPSEPRVALCFHDSSVLSNLREIATNIIGINEKLCSCINKGTFLNNNIQLIRHMKVLHNTIMREERGYVYPGYATCELATFAKRTFLAGKRLVTYIFPFTDFWASQVYYLDTYTVNLELDNNFKVFYDLVYLYIYLFYRSWSSCNWAAYPEAILVNICTLVYFSSKVIVLIIISHDKYQSLILIGLAHAEKANSGNRSVLVHYRSYWREWRPLVTPSACCIKEGIESWKSRRWLFTSHVQVSVSLCSLSSSPVLFCFYCYYYFLLLLLLCIFACKGFIMTVVMKTNLVLNIAIIRNANLDLSIAMVMKQT